MIGIEGTRLSRDERRFLERVQPAGVIYFRRNVRSPRQLFSLSRSIREILGPGALIGIDQEGGRVARLGPPFTLFPGNDYLGRIFDRTGRDDFAVRQAEAMARELRSIGVNLNFTPVADVNSNPRNPVIGSRSFGGDPKRVSRLVARTIHAYRREGVLSCAKHFPGHGDTFSDSHHVLPVVRAGRSTLLRREIPPFCAAIRAGVPTLMTAHVIYPALDAKNPATLSPRILQDLLRKRLRFRGVVISDDLEMNAIARHQSVPDAALEALSAGVDLLLVCKTLDLAGGVYERIWKGLRDGELDPRRIGRSLRRVSAMLSPTSRIGKPTGKGWPRHAELSNEIERLGSENFLGKCR